MGLDYEKSRSEFLLVNILTYLNAFLLLDLVKHVCAENKIIGALVVVIITLLILSVSGDLILPFLTHSQTPPGISRNRRNTSSLAFSAAQE